MHRTAVALFFVLWTTSMALAWGPTGHAVIAEIADRRLIPTAVTGIAGLIGTNVSLASIASWADDFASTPGGERTKAWHYVDLDVTSSDSNWIDECVPTLQGDCLPSAVKYAINTLKDTKAGVPARTAALKFVVNLVGDATQPLNCTERNGDHGGRSLVVIFEGNDPNGRLLTNPDKTPRQQKISFHELWDSALVDTRASSFGSYVDMLEASVVPRVPAQPDVPADKDFDEWVKECHKIGVRIYQLLPPGNTPTINATYQQAAQGIVDWQLATAGVRLAAILNSIFKP